MRLKDLEIEGFQSYQSPQRLEFEPHVTLIAGRNDVGKSALLRALRSVTTSQPIADPHFRLQMTATVARADLFADLQDKFGEDEEGAANVLDTLTVDGSATVRAVFRRRPTDGVVRLVEAQFSEAVARVWMTDEQKWSFDRTLVGNDSTGGAFQTASAIHSSLARLTYVAPRRSVYAPDDSQVALRTESVMLPDGSNLIQVLSTLMLSDHQRFSSIVGALHDAFSDITDISVQSQETPGQQPQGRTYVDYRTGERHPLSQCGTGVEQLLVLATGVLTAPTPRVMLIDEPHAYLHPHAERSLARFIAAHTEHQYVIVTHSSVLLRSFPLAQSRLITRSASGSQVTQLTEAAPLLDELGVTPADLWLADAILWVEGPSDRPVVSAVAASVARLSGRHVSIEAMPAASRFSGRESAAASSFAFIERVVEAIAPTPEPMLFLFDADEKTAEQKARLVRASGDRSVFLEVREMENVLLDVPSITEFLVLRSAEIEAQRPVDEEGPRALEPPAEEDVRAIFDVQVSSVEDRTLYKQGLPLDEDRLKVVAGSVLLDRLTQHFLNAPYDKTRDNGPLSSIMLRRAPERFREIERVLEQIADSLDDRPA